jgi:hypothetical protein
VRVSSGLLVSNNITKSTQLQTVIRLIQFRSTSRQKTSRQIEQLNRDTIGSDFDCAELDIIGSRTGETGISRLTDRASFRYNPSEYFLISCREGNATPEQDRMCRAILVISRSSWEQIEQKTAMRFIGSCTIIGIFLAHITKWQFQFFGTLRNVTLNVSNSNTERSGKTRNENISI